MKTLLLVFCVLLGQMHAKEITAPPSSLTAFYSDSGLLEGPENEINFINAFPLESYDLVNIPLSGYFYLDRNPDCIKDVLRRGIAWEITTMNLIKKYASPNSTVVDIGAHIGTHTLTMSRCVGNNGRVYAFEPQMKVYRELVMNMQENDCKNISAYRCAMGDTEKMIEMRSAFPENEGATGIGSGGDYAFMLPLDDFDLNKVSFIKIDVENTEDEVLEGARQTIMRNRPVMLVEIMGNIVYSPANREQCVLRTIKKLENMGYKVSHFECNDYLAIPK